MNAPAGSFDHSRRSLPASGRRTIKTPFPRSLEARRLQSSLALLVGDLASVYGAFCFSQFLCAGRVDHLDAWAMIIPLFLIFSINGGSYDHKVMRNKFSGSLIASKALIIAGLFFHGAKFYFGDLGESQLEYFLAFSLIGVSFLAVARTVMRHIVRWFCGAGDINQLVIWDGGPEVKLPGAICISAEVFRLSPALNDPVALNRIGILLKNVDRVVVSSIPERSEAWAHVLKGANIEGDIVNDVVAKMAAHGARLVDGQGFLKVSTGPLGLNDRIKKRLLDIFVSSLALIFFAPLMIFVAIAVKIEDGGPVFFVQKRVGRGNCFFAMLKFRSMSVNSEGVHGGVSASRSDERITRVGKFIRSTSIDELPQLFNVLIGQMSLVGPRPHALGSLAGGKLFWEVDKRYWQRHALKPGLTGLAQVRGYRGATDTENDLSRRLDADLEYSRGWTLGRDLWIMPSTLRVLLHHRAF